LNIQSLSRFGGTVTLSGTSMSTPHIAGLLFSGSIGNGGFIKGDKDSQPDPIAVYSGTSLVKPVAAPKVNPVVVPAAKPVAAPKKNLLPVPVVKPKKKRS
jgi:hypothetical protein